MSYPTARRAFSVEEEAPSVEPVWLVQARRFAPRMGGTTVELLTLPENDGVLRFGRNPECEIWLPDFAVAPCHAVLEKRAGVCQWRRASGGGDTWINGLSVTAASLLPGDRIHLGPYTFVFEGNALACIAYPRALTVAAIRLRQNAGRVTQLNSISLLIQPGEFIGILGPSGAGKTTLLEALSGVRPAHTGSVLINGEPLYQRGDALRHLIGYVPQDDILHRELTCRQAWRYAATLRLPRDVRAGERHRLVEEMLAALDLTDRADVPIGKLSGGQRKRANVGAELLGRPGILFLDEPTAGLDPGTETRLMQQFKALTRQRQTVVCTTHVVENVDLFDKVAVLAPGGALAYFGSPDGARGYFGISRLADLYERLEKRPASAWQDQFAESNACIALQNQLAGMQISHPVWHWSDTPRRGLSPPKQAGILLRRFCRILTSDRRNLALALTQPLAIAVLVCLVYRDLPRILFLLVVALLWFACSAAAQQIVKERRVYRRERQLNLNLPAYIASKFLPLAVVAIGQGALMMLIIWLFHGGGGDMRSQFVALALTGCNATVLGLIVSALAANADKATSAVPLVMLPQIILAGVLVPVPDMSLPMRITSTAIVARWSNNTMEATLLHGRKVDTNFLDEETLLRPLWNLYPEYDWSTSRGRQQFLADHAQSRLEQKSTLDRNFAILGAFVPVQLGFLVLLLRRQDL
jgi:ABC-type multidrug transport system ATPase subunit